MDPALPPEAFPPLPPKLTPGMFTGFSYADFKRKRALQHGEGAGGGQPSSSSSSSRGWAQRTGSMAASSTPPPPQAYRGSPSLPPSVSSRGDPGAYGVVDRNGGPSDARGPFDAYGGGGGGGGGGVPAWAHNGGPGKKGKKAKKRKQGRWESTAVPAANGSSSAAHHHYHRHDDSDLDSEDDRMYGGSSYRPAESRSSQPPPSASLAAPGLLDPTGGRTPPPGAPVNWGKSKHKRLRLKGNVDFGKRPTKGRLDQTAPSTSDESSSASGSERAREPHYSRGWEGTSESESDYAPRAPPKAMLTAAAHPPPPPPPPPSFAAPVQMPTSQSTPAPAGPTRYELALEKLARAKQQTREREAADAAAARTAAAAPRPVPAAPKAEDEWGQAGWSTPQPSQRPAASTDGRTLRLDRDAAHRFVEHHAPAREKQAPWQSRQERAWRAANPSASVEVKAEPDHDDMPIPPPIAQAAGRIATRQPEPAPAPEPAPIEEADVKPDVRRLPSPPAPPPPAYQKQGVAGYLEADLPPDCTSRDPSVRKRARMQFLSQKRWELQNERKQVVKWRWIASGLAIDWKLDKTQGTWTLLYPNDVRTAEAKARFLQEQVAIVESKGWTVMAQGEQMTGNGVGIGIVISWENERPTPSPEPEQVPSASAATSTAADTPAIRVKDEPVDSDNAIPTSISAPSTTTTSNPRLSAAPPLPAPDALPVSSVIVPKPEPEPTDDPLSLVTVFTHLLSEAAPLAADLRAVDLDHNNLDAVAHADAHLTQFLKQFEDAIRPRLGRMADRIRTQHAEQDSRPLD